MFPSPRVAAEATLHRVLDTSQEASLIHRDSVVEYVNPAFRALLGYEAGDHIGEGGANELLHPDDQATLVDAQRRFEAGEELPSRVRFFRKDGSIQWTDCVRTRIDYLGAPAIIVRARDIRQPTGAIAHDFNNILAVILGIADAMLWDLDDAHPFVEDLREIAAAARRGSELTHRLLAYGGGDQRSTRAEKSR